MKVTIFNTKPHDEQLLRGHNAAYDHEMIFIENRLKPETALLAERSREVCALVNDALDSATLEQLANGETEDVAVRCAGYHNFDLSAAKAFGIQVARVPAYSPYAAAEHAVALLLCLNRHVHKAYNRVRERNFLIDGLMGSDVHGKMAGVIGTGIIGSIFAKIMLGFGCEVLAYDVVKNPACIKLGINYVSLDELFSRSHAISLPCPLLPQTHHLIGNKTLGQMRDGVFIINTSRGALIDTEAATTAIKCGRIGGLALDVYEEKSEFFFDDHSFHVIQDDVLMRLTTFPNILITSHQAFFTREAMGNISKTTLRNLADFEAGSDYLNLIQMN